jgi:hypothetical protein
MCKGKGEVLSLEDLDSFDPVMKLSPVGAVRKNGSYLARIFVVLGRVVDR